MTAPEVRPIKKTETTLSNFAQNASATQEAFLSDQDFAHAYKGGDGNSRVTAPTSIHDATGAVLGYPDRDVGNTTIKAGKKIKLEDEISGGEKSLGVDNNGDIIALASIGFAVMVKDVDFTAEGDTIYFVDTSVNNLPITVTLPDATVQLLQTRIYKISDVDSPDITVTTVGGVQNIGNNTTQVISGRSEGFSLVENITEYEIVQDNRGGLARSLAQSTGIVTGFTVTPNVDPTKVDISAGIAIVVDTTDYKNPSTKFVRYDGQTALAITNLATSGYTTLAIMSDGVVEQRLNTISTTQQLRTAPHFAVVSHLLTPSLTTADIAPWWVASQNPSARISSLMTALGPINSGVFVAAIAGEVTARIQTTAGDITFPGLDSDVDHNNPDNQPILAQNPVEALLYVKRDEILSVQTGVNAVVPVDQYDESGVITPIGGNTDDCTIHRIYMTFSNVAVMQYGQNQYTSPDEALAALSNGTDSFVKNPLLNSTSALLGAIIAEKSDTNLNNALIILANRNGDLAQSAGALQSQNLNSVLQTGNDAGGQQIKNILNGTDPQDAVAVSQLPTLQYSHETTFGREGLNNIPIGTDFDLPFPWYGEGTAGQYGFDGQAGNPDRALKALASGAIVGMSINMESLSNDVELGVKINGVKHGTTWTISASTSEGDTGLINIPYSQGDKIIPFLLNNTVQWGGIGIGCAIYTRGDVV